MQHVFFSAVIVACQASTMSTVADCDQFEESKLCVSHLTNLIDRLPTEDEVVCQELCQSHTKCSHFTFMEDKYPLENGEPDLQCYMWKRCISKVTLYQSCQYSQSQNFLYQIPCSSMDCSSSVAGPVRPSMPSSCCSQFQSGVCNSPPIQTLPTMAEGECQRRCRTEKDCLFYSNSPNACILHSSCSPVRKPCQGCRSGAKRPPLDKLPSNCGDDVTTTTTTTKGKALYRAMNK